MAQTLQDLIGKKSSAESNNKVGVMESMLSGIASGIIAIPKGFFSLGASLMDLGANTGKAAAVEQFFDDLTTFDEKAEATAAGKITELLVNIGIPGGIALKGASGLAKSAMLARQNGKYVKLNDPKLLDDLGKGTTLTGAGRARQAVAGALGAGAAEATFVGDVKGVGTFGDLLGGPTKIDRSDTDPNATREILNRIKFGTEGALFTGILGGTGKVIKKITNRNKGLDTANSQLDRWIDTVTSKFRARSGKTQEFFDIERGTIGEQSSDANVARNLSRDLDVDVDKLFPPMRTVFNKQNAKERSAFLGEVNDALLSGEAKLGDDGVAAFGEIDNAAKQRVMEGIRKYAPTKEAAEELEKSILGGLSVIRSKWSELFSKLGGSIDSNDLATFKQLFGNKFKNYLGATYDIFQEKSIIPFLRYKPAAQAVKNAEDLFKASAKEAGKELTDLEAEQIVSGILRAPIMPKGFRADKPSDALFKIPDFFVNRTALDDALTRSNENIISIRDLASEADRKVFDDLFGNKDLILNKKNI